MSMSDEMTVNERRNYLNRMQPWYQQATRREQGRLLNEMEQVTGMHRKSLTRFLHVRSHAKGEPLPVHAPMQER